MAQNLKETPPAHQFMALKQIALLFAYAHHLPLNWSFLKAMLRIENSITHRDHMLVHTQPNQ